MYIQPSALITDMSPAAEIDSSMDSAKKRSSLLVRTSWQPPMGVSAEGIFIVVDDGRRLIDAVGGAAVACIGGNHPVVMQAIKAQVDKVSCTPHFSQHWLLNLLYLQMFIVCNCQTNQPKP